MSSFIRIPLGLAVMVVGFFIVKKTEVVFSWFGEIPFIEEKVGMGSSRFAYKVIGMLTVFLGIFIATNIISDTLTSVADILT